MDLWILPHYFRTELTTDEYDRMKLDTVDQIGEFTETLNRMQSGDVTLDSKFTLLRKSIRQAISAAYKTTEIRQAFGTGSALAVDGEAAENEKRMVLEKLFGQMEQVDDDDEEEGQFT